MVNINKIRHLAKLKGLKLAYLQDQLGVRHTFFAEVDAGKTNISEERLNRLANMLGTTVEYLMDITDNPAIPRKVTDKHPVFSYDRFRQRCVAKGITVGYAESRLDLESGSINYAEDTDRIPSEALINKMAILLDTTYDYLTGLSDDPTIPLNDKTGVKIGVFGDVAAGIPIDRIENFDPEDPDSWEEIDRWTAKGGTYFGLKIKGDSMSPRMLEGDVVIVRSQPTAESGEIAVVAINGDFATCKRIFWDEAGGISLVSLNPNYPPRHFSADQVRSLPVTILGKVVELRGKY